MICYLFALTVRATGIHVDGKAETGWIIFIASSAK